MRFINELVEHIDDEIKGAKDYAESYLTCKAKGDSSMATKYKEMANDELKHSNYIHDKAIQEITELEKVYTPPQEMLDMWDKAHKNYIEKVAWIKQMLTM